MLPPLEETVLHLNPQFAALRSHLSTHLLGYHGQTICYPRDETLAQNLTSAQIRELKRNILVYSLRSTDIAEAIASAKLNLKHVALNEPNALTEVLLLLATGLCSPVGRSEKPLSSREALPSFQAHLHRIGVALGATIHTTALSLCRLVNPQTNPSYLHRQIPALHQHCRLLQRHIAEQKAVLDATRARLGTLASRLLVRYHDNHALVVSHLEHTKHGSIARNGRSKTEHLALQAQEVAEKAREKCEDAEKIIYTGVARQALEAYLVELRVAEERLGERGREAKRVLSAYGIGTNGVLASEKEKRMRETARVYGELLKELEGVKRDMKKLRG